MILGLGFGLIYSIISMALDKRYHRIYTLVFAFLITLAQCLGLYMPQYIHFNNGLVISSFYTILLVAIASHLGITAFFWFKN